MQVNNMDVTNFQEETDTFNLTVTLEDNKLTLLLRDYVDWTIYSKIYTQSDIGKDIHQKMDLLDVYSAFAQTRLTSDEESMKREEAKLKKYEFGSVIQKNQVPLYKIEKQGRVTCYLSMIDRKTRKEVSFETKLKLDRVRNILEQEKLTIKLDMLRTELRRENEQHLAQRELLLTRIANLDQLNIELKKEVTKMKQQMKQMTESMKEANSKLGQKFTPSCQCSEVKLKMLKSEILAEMKQLMGEFSTNVIDELRMQLATKSLQSRISRKSTMDLDQPNTSFFRVDGFKVLYTGNDTRAQYIFNEPIQPHQSASFKIKITQARNRDIIIGVVDYGKQKDKKFSWNSNNAMCYYGVNGYKCPEGIVQGDGFKQGDIVEVDVSRSNSTVKYFINGTLRAQHFNQMLTDASRTFMPYVEMVHYGDSVEWLQ